MTSTSDRRNIGFMAAYRPTEQRCEAGRRPPAWEEVVAYLTTLGAEDINHPGGTLLAHLIRTGELLFTWGARPSLVYAGLCHAAYGTDGFPIALRPLDQRNDVADVVGAEAEGMIYQYASCDRRLVFPRLGREGPVPFRDRFTGDTTMTDPFRLSDFLELTFANELDLVSHSRSFAAKSGPGIADVFTRCTPYVSPPARRAFRLILGCHL